VIERSLIVCETADLTVDESWLAFGQDPALRARRPVSPRLPEKEMIEAALAESGGKVSGPQGAAVKLKMPASTLDYKIRVLKINKFRFKTD
jgi:transcriptional regulator with GAF, ATPase, and Fis domain